MKDIKFIFLIATERGPENVAGHKLGKVGLFGAYRSDPKGMWHLTHLPTGARVCSTFHLAKLRTLVKAIEDRGRWLTAFYKAQPGASAEQIFGSDLENIRKFLYDDADLVLETSPHKH